MGVTDSPPTVAGVVVNVGPAQGAGRANPVPGFLRVSLRVVLASLLLSATWAAGALTKQPALSRGAPPGFLEMLRQSFALDHRLDQPVVLREIDRVRHSPAYLEELSSRIERYLLPICTEAIARGIPGEICLLPIIESGVDPAAESRSGARGLWQLIPGTARRYGLNITWRADERRDPVASTDAALRYLSDLRGLFGDWTLALAAYNCGETNVANALEDAAAGASFFDLRWPTETSVYVPKLLALAAIFADPSAHGVALPNRLRVRMLSDARTLPAGLPGGGGKVAPAQSGRPASSLREASTAPMDR